MKYMAVFQTSSPLQLNLTNEYQLHVLALCLTKEVQVSLA